LVSTTNRIIFRSLVRPATADDPNLRSSMLDGEDSDDPDIPPTTQFPIIQTANDRDIMVHPVNPAATEHAAELPPPEPPPIFNPEDLIGRSFNITTTDEESQEDHHSQATIVSLIKNHKDKTDKNPELVKFLLSIDVGAKDKIITYNQLMDHIYNDTHTDSKWKFKRLTAISRSTKST